MKPTPEYTFTNVFLLLRYFLIAFGIRIVEEFGCMHGSGGEVFNNNRINN